MLENASLKPLERKSHYDLLRVLLVVLVVIGHSTYLSIQTPFGGIHYTQYIESTGLSFPIFYKLACVLTSWIYTFHMPVFIALSGSLFALSNPKPYLHFITSKAQRLLIPFFVVWLLWNLPIKYVTGYYSGVSITGMLAQLIFPSCVYLWYLECLFFVFALAYWIVKLNAKLQLAIVTVAYLIGVVVYQVFGDYHLLGDPLYYLGWFYLGYHIESIIKWMKRKHFWQNAFFTALFLVDLFLFAGNKLLDFKYLRFASKHFFYPFLMLIILNYLVRHLTFPIEVLKVMSGYGMGIYLYAEPLNYLFLYWFYVYCGIEFFSTNTGAMCIYFSRLIITPLISILITWILKKMKLKYLY